MDNFKLIVIRDGSSITEKKSAIRNNTTLIKNCFRNNSQKYLGELLAYYPLSDKKLKMFQQLNLTQKRGFISRYIMGCASKSGIPDVYIKDFLSLKYRQREKKYKADSEDKLILRSKVLQEEIKLLKATLQQTRKISIRKRKLDEIFFK
jgi:hypothetical protein